MVGTTVLGDGKLSAKTLPPEARALNRFFRLLVDPRVIREAVTDVIDHAPSTSQVVTIRMLLDSIFEPLKLFENRNDSLFEHKLALGINSLIENTFAGTEDDLESLGSPHKPTRDQTPLHSSLSDPSLGGIDGPETSYEKSRDVASIAVVSDASETEVKTQSKIQPQALGTTSAFWAHLLEAIHLQVVARTTRIWGRKKIYEIYRLNGPATALKALEQIRAEVQRDFSAAYSGIECRTYALQRQDGYLFLHLVIGEPYNYTDERNRSISGEKKKKKANEFMFVVKPGSDLMAVTASRAPSKSRFVKYVLTAVDLALATTDKNVAQNVVYEPPTRVGDSCGTEPMDLLQAAHAADTGEATGRFAHLASNDAHLDPLTELQQVSTMSVVDRTAEQARLRTSAQHGRNVGQEAAAAARIEGAALAMSSDAGAVIDHDASIKEKRLQLRGMTLGEGGAQLKKVRFKWEGETTACSEVWDVSGPAQPTKCTISFRGNDVFEGLRELQLESLQAPLPAYMFDALTVGTSTINVRNGAIVVEK